MAAAAPELPAAEACGDGAVRCRPFLKWPGGKYRLIERIRRELLPGQRLIEPFVGSGAVFINTDYPRYVLADANHDLISLFQILKREGQSFIDGCRSYFSARNNQAVHFYALREQFNACRDPITRAKLFVYLNRHCYNGLCRYNAKGHFNTPFGRYQRPYFPEREMRHFAKHARQARFTHAHFGLTLARAVQGDVVYCDPPYAPLSNTANFTGYSAGGFDWQQQEELARLAQTLAERGIRVLISNHDTPRVRALYRRARLIRFPVRRTISCQGHGRALVGELLAVFRS